MPTAEGLTDREVMRIVNRYIGVSGGYLGDFSYRTHSEFYPEYCDLQISTEMFGTTRERFISILSSRPPREQAAIVRGIVERFSEPEHGTPEDLIRRGALAPELLGWAAALEGASPVTMGNPTATREVVLRALDDADTLLRTSGAPSVVDRMHTALHGHLFALCESAGIDADDEATLPQLLRALRTNHPRLRAEGARADDVTRILMTLSGALDALLPIRNRASVAHPNRELLDDAEAMLVVNATRTILAYIDSKLGTP